MKFYLAPMEGVTGHVFREAYDLIFGNMDCYYTPFLSANDHLSRKTRRELGFLSDADSSPVALKAPLIPQILGNDADKVIALSEEIAALGYDTVNLNFGCPSGTVTAKNRGSGILKDLVAMDDFLARVFAGCKCKISLKTRIGYASLDEWKEIVEVYRDYPFSEIIIHPRLREEMYKGTVHKEAFAYALEELKAPLCFNGDVFTVEDYCELCKLFPKLDSIMLGRGVVRNPFLVDIIQNEIMSDGFSEVDITQNKVASGDFTKVNIIHNPGLIKAVDINRAKRFVRALEEAYLSEMKCEEHAVMRMKEFWYYYGESFPGREKALKKIKKAHKMNEYRLAVSEVMN